MAVDKVDVERRVPDRTFRTLARGGDLFRGGERRRGGDRRPTGSGDRR
jgi:hypothetical protein